MSELTENMWQKVIPCLWDKENRIHVEYDECLASDETKYTKMVMGENDLMMIMKAAKGD